MAKVFVTKENRSGETRVAATPETVKKMVKLGLEVQIETGCGAQASMSDQAFMAAGATVAADRRAGLRQADVVLGVGPASLDDIGDLPRGAVLFGLLQPYRESDTVLALAKGGVSALALELVPRITRAQAMDVLSSQASIAGYKAVLLGAVNLGKHFPMLMTAAGTIPAARVVIMGAGVAGLQAIATARRLGAQVEVSDIRPAVKEQVESLGAKFIDLPQMESGEGQGGYAKEMTAEFLAKQRQILTDRVSQADVVITTALVPGRPAPRLLSREMVEAMKPGSVVVDLAIEQGGNCELSRAETTVEHHGVKILAPRNLAASLATDASTLYARNLLSLLQLMVKDGAVSVNLEDEVIAGTLLTHAGDIRHAATAERLAVKV
jgi:NAD(P) transhydrogenase subunit alpha